MTEQDWHDEDLNVVTMFVSGAPLRSPARTASSRSTSRS